MAAPGTGLPDVLGVSPAVRSHIGLSSDARAPR